MSADMSNNSSLNTSTSKQMYSVPRALRFKEPFRSPCNRPFYDVPDTKSKRHTSFGYGNKMDMSKSMAVSPPPNTYSLKSNFEAEKAKARGFSFGLGREQMQQGGAINTTRQASPGPARYQLRGTLSNMSFSIRPRTPNPELNHSYLKNPGPGAYEYYSGINQTGR